MLFERYSFSENYRIDVKEFFAPAASGSSSTYWQVWEKPKWASFIQVFLVGPGGAGANGTTGAAGTTRAGGGGGGAGGVSKLFAIAPIIPDNLYISIGVGPSPGVNGQPSTISIIPNDLATPAFGNLFLLAGAGGNGSSSTAGIAGAAQAVNTTINGQLGYYNSIAGSAGSNGSNTAVAPTNLTLWSASFVVGGCGGGGATNTNTNSNGGGYTSNWIAGPAGGTAPGGNGINGTLLLPPKNIFSSIGGTGGAGSGTGTGGNGGNGALGCGGGGGGAGVTGGNGGRGGDGYCLIICY